jgi:hypothetical protein
MLINMIIEVALGGKRLKAPSDIAVVGSLTSVDPHVGLQVTLLVECTATVRLRADVLFLAHMSLQMHIEAQLPSIGLVTALEGAPEGLLFYMRLHVIVKVTFRHEGLTTLWVSTGKRSLRFL